MEADFIKISKGLIPLSWLYGLGVRVRNLLFDIDVLKSKSFNIPVISVGNITVGGSGKTPHVEYLVQMLCERYKVAVLSRGYKRKTKGYVLAKPGISVKDIGDEPYQMYMKFGDDSSANPIHVAVDAKRVEGIERLIHDKETKDTQVIILDDAYQHRYVKPSINILLVDYHRLITHDKLLPAGRLREPQSGKKRADIVIITKCPEDMHPINLRVISKAMDLYPCQKLFFTQLRYDSMRTVFGPSDTTIELKDITPAHNVMVIAGIASPKHLLGDLKKYTHKLTPKVFSDHHNFTQREIDDINNTFDILPHPRIVITTEKDATRLAAIDGLSNDVKRNLYVLPVKVGFMQDQEKDFRALFIK